MQYEPKGTLAYYDALPHAKHINLGHVPSKNLAINCSKYVNEHSMIRPEVEAVTFYALNHLASMVRAKFTKHEALPEWAVEVMDAYTKELVEGGKRMMYYLALITARESRHVAKNSTLHKKLDSTVGPGVFTYLETVPDNASGAVKTFMNDPPPGTLVQYFRGLQIVFYEGQFGGGGFGGKPWGDITKCLSRFLEGETSMEVMLDTSFTLCHNNGPIFNKGMCYHQYDGQTEFLKILDIQRSGQMPEAVRFDPFIKQYVENDLGTIVAKVMTLFPDEFGPEVCYFKVKALGGIGDYQYEMSKQKIKPPPPVIKVAGGTVIGKLQVFPGQSVNIIKRETAPA